MWEVVIKHRNGDYLTKKNRRTKDHSKALHFKSEAKAEAYIQNLQVKGIDAYYEPCEECGDEDHNIVRGVN